PLRGNRVPRWRMSIGRDVAHPDAVVAEHIRSPALLNAMMLSLGTPANQRFLVAPRGMRQHPTWAPLAFKALVVHEALDLLEPGLQMGRQRQVVIGALMTGIHFENH